MSEDEIRAWLVDRVAHALRLLPSEIDVHEPFNSYGLTSKDALLLSGDLEEMLGRQLSPTLIYDYPDIHALSRHLGRAPGTKQQARWSGRPAMDSRESIAIVGIACRFPGAPDVSSFWQLLRDGRDAISEVPHDRWDADAFYHPDASIPGKAVTRWGGFLDGIEGFDPFFFGISPGEAERMDPQQRLLMELAYESIEDGGYSMERLAGTRTGVYVGICVNEYGLRQVNQFDLINGHSGTGNALSIAANRISYFFDLCGPSMAIDTACSSSLVAVHLACGSLRSGECDLALAGGVSLMLSPAHSIAFTKAGVLARNGRCKVFDARADGYVRGEGGSLIVLKPLSKAIADGDPVYAVILGSAVHHNGRTNGLMAPSGKAQEAVLRAAYRDANVAPGLVQYVEAHGTGTLLGDSIEAGALGAVLSLDRLGGPCAVGSVKSNIGHLEAAAGVAGLVKVALSLKHRAIPPSLHYEKPNPHVPFDDLGLHVQQELGPWPDHTGPALAGVSSFGFGGANVHVVLGEAEETATDGPTDEGLRVPVRAHLLPLSAQSPGALQSLARAHRDFLATKLTDRSVSLRELCFGAGVRRSHHDCRLAVVARSKHELRERLESFLSGMDHPDVLLGRSSPGGQGKVVFVFSGQGSQWHGMGQELLQNDPDVRATLTRCDEALGRHVEWSLLEQLIASEEHSRLNEIDVLQPTLFALQVALATQWRSWGVEPDAVVGHSMGEVAAAHVAGALSLGDAARVICARSRLLKRLSGRGRMAVLGLSCEETARSLVGSERRLRIAASNSPRSTVVSGDSEALAELIASLQGQDVFCSWVNVDVASHGPQTAPLRDELRQCLAGLRPRPTSLPLISTVTGGVRDGLRLDAEYWARNLTEPVNFGAAVQALLQDGHKAFIEISTHPILQTAVQQCLVHLEEEGTALASLRREEPERSGMLRSLGALYVSGRTIDWRRVHPTAGRPVSLPSYPWQRERFWMDATAARASPSGGRPDHRGEEARGLLGERTALARPSGAFIWRADLDVRSATFLRDHRIEGQTVVPASAYVEMALSAAASTGIADTHVLSDVTFRRSLILPADGPRRVQVTLYPEKDGILSLSLFSHGEETGREDWSLHAVASFIPERTDGARPPNCRSDLDAIRQACSQEVCPDEFYRTLERRGLDYGPTLRGIDGLCRRDGEALGRISLSEVLAAELDRYQIHPALLDASLQVLAATLADFADRGDDRSTYVPVGCGRIRLHSRPGRRVWSHVVLRSGTEAGASSVEGDIRLLDESGRWLVELTGLRLARVARPRLIAAPTMGRDTWLYRVHWRQATLPAPALAVERSGEGGNRWIILSDRHGVGEALARLLESRGQNCELVGHDRVLEGRQRIDEWLPADRSPLRGVIHLWSLDAVPFSATEPSSLKTAQTLGCNSALSLVQGLVARRGSHELPRLWLVTRGAQPALAGESVSVEQAPLWGLGKSIRFELPELRCTLVDLDASVDAGDSSELLCRQLFVRDEEDQVAIRGSRRFVPRVLPYSQPEKTVADSSASPGRLRTDGSYLITGGLGGLGVAVAEWMIKQGARSLVLVGRREPSPEAATVVGRMRHAGASVSVMAADVADGAQVAGVLGRIRKDMPSIRGVVHAAGVLDNGSVLKLDTERMSKVMDPKVLGAWNLHAATLGDPLDFFVLFSSAVSVLGSPGQANYAAANSFLDALSHHRHSAGLPSISINWGPWAETGLMAGGDYLDAAAGRSVQGVKGIRPSRGLEVLGRALQDPNPQMTVLPFDLRSLLDLYPAAATNSFFAEVGGEVTRPSRLYARPVLRQEYLAPRNEIERKLVELWRQTLRMDRVGVRDSFFELGGDSVLAAQIIASADRTFGVGIDLRDAFAAFTIENLAKHVEAAFIARIEGMTESETRRSLEE